MKKEMKRWLISSLITFVGGFVGVLALSWDSVTVDSFQDGSLIALLLVATRAGVKASVEYFIKK